MIRNWLTMLLRQLPDRVIEIDTASNVDDALTYCASNEVHLVITDITMPQRTGLELLQILRDNYPNIHVAVLSAYDDYQYIRTAMRLGAIDYILKAEMELDDLLAVIRKVELLSNDTLSIPVVKGVLERNILMLTQKSIQIESVFTVADIGKLRTELKRQLSLLQCRQYYADASLSAVFQPLEQGTMMRITKNSDFFWIFTAMPMRQTICCNRWRNFMPITPARES